jgi:maleate isomerase
MRRTRIGVVLTAPNTVLEADLWQHGADRVSWHSSRVADRPYDPSDPTDHAASVNALAGDVDAAIAAIKPVDPVLVVVGLSAAPFKSGVAGHIAWKQKLERSAGVPVVTLADGIGRALAGLSVRRVALLTPLHPKANAPIASYLGELGVSVERDIGLSCADTATMAAIGEELLYMAVTQLDAPEIEAIVQVGTNLEFVSVAARATEQLGKPVIAANTAIAAAALERAGVV